MDPQVTLYEFLEALRDDRKEDASEMAQTLADWLAKGGEAPKVNVCRNEQNIGGPVGLLVFKKE